MAAPTESPATRPSRASTTLSVRSNASTTCQTGECAADDGAAGEVRRLRAGDGWAHGRGVWERRRPDRTPALRLQPDGLPAGRDAHQPSKATGTVMRPSTFRGYALEAGFGDVEILPLEHDLFRFYRLIR